MTSRSKHLHKQSKRGAKHAISRHSKGRNVTHNRRYHILRKDGKPSAWALKQIDILASLEKFNEDNTLSDKEIDRRLARAGLSEVHSYANLKKLGLIKSFSLTRHIGRRRIPESRRAEYKRMITEFILVLHIFEKEAEKLLEEGNLNPSDVELRERLRRAFTKTDYF